MSIYRFESDSLLDEVEIVRTDGGGVRAYLRAREGADASKLNALKNQLEEADFQWSPISCEGRPLLEVREFGKEEKLLAALKKFNAVGTIPVAQSAPEKSSFIDKLKKRTLQLSGLMYFPGDMGYLHSTSQKAFENGKLVKPEALAAGIFYALGSPFIIFFGKGDKSDFQLKECAFRTCEELTQAGFATPKGAAITSIIEGHNDGLKRKILNFCNRFPSEITNSLFGVAGFAIMVEQIRMLKNKTTKNRGHAWAEMGLGAVTVAAGLASLVDEEKIDPNAPKKTGFARAWQWVKEKPLRTAAALLGVSTVYHGAMTADTYRIAKKTLNNASSTATDIEAARNELKETPGRALFVGTNLLAEGLMAVSSKGHGAGVKSDTSLEQSLYAGFADFIYQSPDEQRESLLIKIAASLSDKKKLGGDAAQIEAGIREQLIALESNPWVAKTPTTIAQHETAAAVTKERAADHWQNVTRSNPTAAATPAL